MTTTTKTAAKTTPAAKEAPAKKSPAKAAATTAAPKLRWVRTGEKDAKGNAPAKAETPNGTYEISGPGDASTATWTPEGGKHSSANSSPVLVQVIAASDPWRAVGRRRYRHWCPSLDS